MCYSINGVKHYIKGRLHQLVIQTDKQASKQLVENSKMFESQNYCNPICFFVGVFLYTFLKLT